jgi:hypothetical protein
MHQRAQSSRGSSLCYANGLSMSAKARIDQTERLLLMLTARNQELA